MIDVFLSKNANSGHCFVSNRVYRDTIDTCTCISKLWGDDVRVNILWTKKCWYEWFWVKIVSVGHKNSVDRQKSLKGHNRCVHDVSAAIYSVHLLIIIFPSSCNYCVPMYFSTYKRTCKRKWYDWTIHLHIFPIASALDHPIFKYCFSQFWGSKVNWGILLFLMPLLVHVCIGRAKYM